MENNLAFVEKWWASLTVAEKERIATKIKKEPVQYPKCTNVWHSLDDNHKAKVYNHCVNDHGDVMPEESTGNPYGD